MKTTKLFIMAIGLTTFTMTACKPNAGEQTETAAPKAATEITEDSVIVLTQPDTSLDVSLMQALADRKSDREFDERQLSLEQLSTLLWAANGINREDGRRTAPSAVNSQDIDIFVCMASGAYLYDAKQNQLTRVTTQDLRQAVAGQQPVMAPVFLVLVADLARYPEGLAVQRELVTLFAAEDAGYVSANIGLYCAAAGLATVPRASMDKDALAAALQLTDSQVLLLNNPVGYKE